MDIQTVTYTGLNDAIEITLSDGSVWYDFAGNPPNNDFRRALAEWIDGGGIIGPFVPPAPVIRPVSRAQALMALYNAGKLEDLEAIVAAHPYQPVRIWYSSANSWERNHAYVAMLGPEMGLSDAQIDSLFIAAASL